MRRSLCSSAALMRPLGNTKAVKGTMVRLQEACKAALEPWRRKKAAEAEAAAAAARAEADRQAREAAEAARAAAGDLGATEAAEELVKAAADAQRQANRAEKTATTGLGLRTVWIATMTDQKAAILHYMKDQPGEFIALAQRLADVDVRKANRVTLRKVLNLVLKLAVRREWIATNPLDGVRLPRKALKGFHDWSDAEIATFEARWKTGTRERLALALLLYTVQRRGDVVTMGRQHVRGGKIYVAQAKSKGRTRLALPVHPALKAEIDALPAGQLTFLQTAYGEPFSPAGFTAWFVEAADDAGLTDSTPHGLRKAGARRLAEMGCTAKQIMAVTGHANLSEVTLYTAGADQVRLAEEAFALLETGTKRLTGVSTP